MVNVLQQHAVFDIVKNFTADYDKPLIFDKVPNQVQEATDCLWQCSNDSHVFKLRNVNTFTFLRVNVVLRFLETKLIDCLTFF